jgi:hypothetical protein
MTIKQLNQFKRWHISHQEGHAVEFTLCDLVLGAWIFGWILLLPLFVLHQEPLLPASLLLILAPEVYCGLRRVMHRRGMLRCDWLDAIRRS